MYQAMTFDFDYYQRVSSAWPYKQIGGKFNKGIRVEAEKIANPVLIQLNSENDAPDTPLPHFWNGSGEGAVFSARLYAAMVAFGVDNLDAYPAQYVDPKTKVVNSGFYVINVIGLIAAADMKKSTATVHAGGPLIDVSFDTLVIDALKARGALVFRLRENTSSIFCHVSLVQYLEKLSFPGLQFSAPNDLVLL